jgi:hypothetical protein
MMVIDYPCPTKLATARDMEASNVKHLSSADKADQTVMIEMHRDAVPNQAGGHGVENAADANRAVGGDFGTDELIISSAVARQC